MYFEGEGAERKVCVELADGKIAHFEGAKGEERMVSVENFYTMDMSPNSKAPRTRSGGAYGASCKWNFLSLRARGEGTPRGAFTFAR